MTVRLTTEKKRKIFDLYRGVLLKESFVIRLVSKLLGKFISSFQAIKYRQLRYRDLERLKIKALKINENNFDKKTSTDTHGKQDIIWWKKYSRVIQYYKNQKRLISITTDASTTGWGTVFKNTSAGGQFSITETLTHINVLELKAILFGLRSLCDHIYGSHSHIKLISDNTTAVHCINNMGSCRSLDCDKIKNSIWDWAIKRRLWLSSAHIPGRLQREAEQKSRKTE